MSEEQINILEVIKEQLGGGRHTKILRFLLNCLSSTPAVGGVFSATASLWSEANQQRINQLMTKLATLTDERITGVEHQLVSASVPAHAVAGYVTFNPNDKAEVIDSSNMSSITDGGSILEFDILFASEIQYYIFNYYGSGRVVLKEVHETVVA